MLGCDFMWNGNFWDTTSATTNNLGPITWTVQTLPNDYTGQTTGVIYIRRYVQHAQAVSAPRETSEIAEFRRAVLSHRTRMLLWQELQFAPRHPRPSPTSKPKLVLTPHQRFSMLGQAHRMGKS